MHELSIAREIIRIVEKVAAREKIPSVKAVGLRLGALAGVDPEALSFSYQAATRDTALDGSNLEIEWLTVRGRCEHCRIDFEIEENSYACPSCVSRDLKIIQGEELEVTHLVEE